jgi:hypothetical protein
MISTTELFKIAQKMRSVLDSYKVGEDFTDNANEDVVKVIEEYDALVGGAPGVWFVYTREGDEFTPLYLSDDRLDAHRYALAVRLIVQGVVIVKYWLFGEEFGTR